MSQEKFDAKVEACVKDMGFLNERGYSPRLVGGMDSENGRLVANFAVGAPDNAGEKPAPPPADIIARMDKLFGEDREVLIGPTLRRQFLADRHLGLRPACEWLVDAIRRAMHRALDGLSSHDERRSFVPVHRGSKSAPL